VGKKEIAQMTAQILAEMPNASEQVVVALERELHERALERAGRGSLSEAIRVRHRRARTSVDQPVAKIEYPAVRKRSRVDGAPGRAPM
jgi:hypothetical protein